MSFLAPFHHTILSSQVKATKKLNDTCFSPGALAVTAGYTEQQIEKLDLLIFK